MAQWHGFVPGGGRRRILGDECQRAPWSTRGGLCVRHDVCIGGDLCVQRGDVTLGEGATLTVEGDLLGCPPQGLAQTVAATGVIRSASEVAAHFAEWGGNTQSFGGNVGETVNAMVFPFDVRLVGATATFAGDNTIPLETDTDSLNVDVGLVTGGPPYDPASFVVIPDTLMQFTPADEGTWPAKAVFPVDSAVIPAGTRIAARSQSTGAGIGPASIEVVVALHFALVVA